VIDAVHKVIESECYMYKQLKFTDFRSSVSEDSVLLGCDTASQSNPLRTFRCNMVFSSSKE